MAVWLVASRQVQAQDPIKSVKVGVNYSRYRGPCPAHLRFTGNIYVDRVPMTYNYQWERSDGAKGKKHVVHVSNSGERHLTIHEEWSLGTPGRTREVWQSLRVRSGNTDVTSEPARVVVECK
ncbi:MAG: hypothetical protein LAO06_00660 [Acidobacteriia bacterium]|nr:hypothetical protein [Terriglobia bacterium]